MDPLLTWLVGLLTLAAVLVFAIFAWLNSRQPSLGQRREWQRHPKAGNAIRRGATR